MAGTSGDAGLAPTRISGPACRINGLHDDVLVCVLSHLDAVELVHTSLLSRRWRGLWRSVPRINAERDQFDGVADTERECDAMFKAFVSRFLMLRNPTALDMFNLVRYSLPDDEFEAVDFDAESEDANLWIGHALQCNARSIDVSVWNGRLILDCSVFASTCYLNSLELSTVALTPGFFKNLQKGCAVLEHLSLYNCCIYDVDICSQTLKVFTIGYECVFQFMERATISIPSLVYLGYFSCYRILPLLSNMESLETASVSLRTSNTMVDDIYQVLRSLSGVANLNFRYKGKQLKVDRNFQWCPKFNRLTILNLGTWCLFADFYALIVFLQNSPNLVKLTVKIKKRRATDETLIGDLEERSFTCEHLKIVRIICSKDLKDNPVLNSLKKLLIENGIISGQIKIVRQT